MAKRSESVKALIEGFFELRQKNPDITIQEIADNYNLSSRTVYTYLDEIAKKNGVTREELLMIPHKKHEITIPGNGRKALERIDSENLINSFNKIIEETKIILKEIDIIMTKNSNIIIEDNETIREEKEHE